MLSYSVRTLPVPALCAGTAGAAVLLLLVDRSPALLLQLAGLAAAAAAATASRLLDEPAASVVDTLPRPMWWRTAARLVPAALLAAAWVAGVWSVELDGVGRRDVVAVQGVAAITIAVGVTTALRRRGHATPGLAVGSTVLLVLTALVLVNPVGEWLPVFPYGARGDWDGSRRLWASAAAVALVTTVVSCVEGGRRLPPALVRLPLWLTGVRARSRPSRPAS